MRAEFLKIKNNCFICIFLKNQAIPRLVITQNTNYYPAPGRSDLLIISASIANLWVYWVDLTWFEWVLVRKKPRIKRGWNGFTQHRNGRNTGCCLEGTTTHPLVSNYTALFLMLVITDVCQVLFLISGLGVSSFLVIPACHLPRHPRMLLSGDLLNRLYQMQEAIEVQGNRILLPKNKLCSEFIGPASHFEFASHAGFLGV